MDIGGILIVVGAILWFVAGYWLEKIRKKEEGSRWGFLLFGILYGAYYGISRWPKTKIPTTMTLAGIVLLVVGIVIPFMNIQGGAQASLPYSDDFSDPNSGWLIYSDNDGSVSYKDGCLHIKNFTSSEFNTVSWAFQSFSDFILEVETWLVAGSNNNRHDIFVRCDDFSNGYLFFISSDGWFGIFVLKGGSFSSSPEATELMLDTSPHISQGQGNTNLVCVECVGSNLKLSVNGHLLGSITDTRFTTGDIGLGTIAIMDQQNQETFTEVAFDNFSLKAP